MDFLFGFIIGVFIGALAGLFCAGMAASASRRDLIEEFIQYQNGIKTNQNYNNTKGKRKR